MAKNRRNLLIEDEVLYEVRSIFVLAFQVVSRSVDEAIEGPECVGERQGGGGDSPGVLSPATGPDGYSAHRNARRLMRKSVMGIRARSGPAIISLSAR